MGYQPSSKSPEPNAATLTMANHGKSLASFVTTYMEDEAEKLMMEAFSKNFIDYEEYPQTAEIQNRCVSMIARLFNCPVDDKAEVMGQYLLLAPLS